MNIGENAVKYIYIILVWKYKGIVAKKQYNDSL